jgi:HEAT repeat protein
MIPYRDITDAADRRWTSRLLEQLEAPGLPEDELHDLIGALQAVSDPRSFAPLEVILTDTVRPTRVRQAAGSVLRGLHYIALDVPADRLRRWWLGSDPLLRHHALLSMDGARCPDIVLRVAGDPTHSLQADALGRMDWWFDLPHPEAVKIAGLSHPDPKVRAAAAYVLLWDEPIAAEQPLIETTFDSVPEVAAEAANTLEYYPTLRVIRCLHELLGHADARVREAVEDSFESIRNEVLSRLWSRDRCVAAHLQHWLAPVWEILAFTDEELRPDEDEDPPARREKPLVAMPVADLLALLADANVSPRVLGDRLRANGWRVYGKVDRLRLRSVLLSHPDQMVRECVAFILADWGDTGGLVELVGDADFFVRKSAMYWLGQVPPTAGIADLAWDHLYRHDTLGVHATETLATFVKHADPTDAVRQLGVIAGDHGWREGLRVAAVDHLARLGATEQVGQLAGLLLEPPAVTWALHLALLDAIRELGLPTPDLGHLREVDNLHVQAAVARTDT